MSTRSGFEALLAQPGLHRGLKQDRRRRVAVLPSGWPELDALLPGGGWPRGLLIELLVDEPGIGELSLLLPALRHSAEEQASLIGWINLLPYAPALAQQGVDPRRCWVVHSTEAADALWAAGQLLRSGSFAVVIIKQPVRLAADLRRLQLAAREGHSIGFCYRTDPARQRPSPAGLRLHLYRHERQLHVRLLRSSLGFGSRTCIGLVPDLC